MTEIECKELGRSLMGKIEWPKEVRAWCRHKGLNSQEEHWVVMGWKMALPPAKGRRAYINLPL